jgi:hypothetical protein
MAINKVVYGNNTLIDISDTTITEGDVESGKTFYKNDGTQATGSYEWSWLGYKPEFMGTVYTEEVALADTLYATWTPSTTAKTIRATATVGTFSANMVNYDYILKWKIRCIPVYTEGTTEKAAPYKECAVIYQSIFRRPNSVANINNKNFNSNACITVYTTPLNVYYNTSGALTYTYSISYGLYGAGTAATISSTTSNTPTVTIKKPTLNARCSSTYFSTTMASAIDKENTKFTMEGELYRVPAGATTRSMYNDLINLYNE